MSDASTYRHLLSSGRIGSLEIRNRIVMTPMGSNLAEADGHVGERSRRYYEARAQGGIGLIIVGVGAVAFPAGACIPNQVAISDDAFLPGLQALTARAHTHGARIAIQLQHAGKVATQDMAAGRPLWVPSLVPIHPGDLLNDMTQDETQAMLSYLATPGAGLRFHEMTAEDIQAVIRMFADAAERARRAGFDGVEIHGAHGYLIAEFLSPATNLRTDAYGGSLENRARLLTDVIRAVKQRAGSDYPVWCRLDAKEFRIENGIQLEDAQRTAELAVAAGADAIHVSAYADATSGVAFTDAPLVHAPCGYVPFAAAIKQRVSVPVIAVGRIEPTEADDVIKTGKADFIAMGRKILADPELPRKLAEGRPEDIRPCIYCYTCVGNIYLNRPVSCAVNPATGREAEFELRPAERSRRVLIAGGGPAGMEAARIAALRGHHVTLCEKGNRLGGTAFFSALVYPPNGRLVEYLETQVRKLPIDVRLDTAVTPQLVRELGPDVVLVAVGARREPPPIPGIDRPHVLSGDHLRSLLTGSDPKVAAEKLSFAQRALLKVGSAVGVTGNTDMLRELSRHWMPIGTRVAILGGGLVGIELAEFLTERDRTVTVLEEGQALAPEMALPRRWRALYELREHGVPLLTGAQVEAITDDGVVYTQFGERKTVPADAVIVATGTRDNRGLAESLSDCSAEVRLLGDCKDVGYLTGAILDAGQVAGAI